MMKRIALILTLLTLLVGLVAMAFSPTQEFTTEGEIKTSGRLAEYDGVSAFPILKDGKYHIR